jgi:hypothetical protein
VKCVRALALVLALSALALAGCGGDREEAAPVMPDETLPETQPATPPPAPARESTVIEGTGLDGELLSSEELRGRPVLVNVWSSW